MTALQIEEMPQIGSTLEVEVDTLYPALSSLTDWVVKVKQARGPTRTLTAVMSSGSSTETKMFGTLPYDENIYAGKARAWGEARGTGTIRFVGRRRFIVFEDPENS